MTTTMGGAMRVAEAIIGLSMVIIGATLLCLFIARWMYDARRSH